MPPPHRYSIVIQDQCLIQSQVPQPPRADGRTNFVYEEEINETACAEAGNIVRITNEDTHACYIGCLFPFPRQGGTKSRQWYSEILLVSALLQTTGEPCRELEAVAVFTDHMNRVNVVRLVPMGAAVDDGDEDFDPDLTSPSDALQQLASPRQRRMSAALEEFKKQK